MTFITSVQPTAAAQRRYRVGFLFNHEAGHQVAHSAPIASQLALSDPLADVVVLGTSDALVQRAWATCAPQARSQIWFEKLNTPVWQSVLARGLDAGLPFSRIANLVRYREHLALFDVLVVPERTSLLLKTLLGPRAPLLVHTKHGSGDRAQGYKPIVGKFDLILASGLKVRERLMKEANVSPQKCAVVGYAKFDAVAAAPKLQLFKNDKPTVVYNPHPQPGLSSWFEMGLDVLDYFSRQRDFNLVFAPHVMLFQRKLHVSLEQLQLRWRRDLPQRFFACDNIRIDVASPKLLDMTYTRNANIYLGDASSQIYEFLLNPRPMVFLNPANKPWQGDANYKHWTFGPVVQDVAGLDAALRDSVAHPHRYRDAQERGFRSTFDLTETPSSLRAAHAISGFARAALFARERHAVDAAGGRVHAI